VPIAPLFCQYSSGPCDQDLNNLPHRRAFFVYPSQPKHHAQTSKATVAELQRFANPDQWLAWEDLPITGQIVFCEICKAARSAEKIVGDITNLNFNVLFELGFALGLRQPILPVRDTTYKAEHLTAVGFFDVLGYSDFQNSKELASLVQTEQPKHPFSSTAIEINKSQPIYYVKSAVHSDGSIKILSTLKKGFFHFRIFDPVETPRLSLHEAYRQVMSSVGIVAHLMDPSREGADINNGRAAFICGMAMAAQKRVLMIQEGFSHQPVDYRDVVCHYENPLTIPLFIERFFRSLAEAFQSQEFDTNKTGGDLLESIDLGDVAAENEIEALSKYFVKTPQFQQTVQGHAQLVVGRKGSGKTAIFYGVRGSLWKERSSIVLDLKPDGHQLIKLREAIVGKMTEGFQDHTLTAFWEYLLLLEIARKILERDLSRAYSDPETLSKYKQLNRAYKSHVSNDEGDFSERFLDLVEKMIERLEAGFRKTEFRSSDITAGVYKTDIGPLRSAILEYLTRSEGVWILFDNIDKGWPARGTEPNDIRIVRCLLEASRGLQRTFASRGHELHTVVFLRKDVHDLLVDLTPDRGKEAAVSLDWSDPTLIKSLLARRIRTSTKLEGDLPAVWVQICDPHVRGRDSFGYILDRTFLRPRDVLNFSRLAIQIAVSRDHKRVEEEDFLAAERTFSEDMTNDLRHEIRDVFPGQPDLLTAFFRSQRVLLEDDVRLALMCADVDQRETDKIIDTLLWFSFLGVVTGDDDRYSYQSMYNIDRLKALGAPKPNLKCVIHPAFHTALEIQI
jgi:hypothetical protein